MKRRQQLPAAYYDGCTARQRKQSSETVPYPTMTCQWSWWRAGWNDTDRTL